MFLEAHGVDTQAAFTVLAGGLAGSKVLDQTKEKMLERDFDPGFRIELHDKDLGIMTAAAREIGIVVPLGSLVGQLMISAVLPGMAHSTTQPCSAAWSDCRAVTELDQHVDKHEPCRWPRTRGRVMTKHVGVVGAGLVGLATAKAVTERLGVPVTLIEKEHSVAVHQSGRNSGVVHAGLYYQPGSLKARLCRRGSELLRAYCEAHELAYLPSGKVVVATHEHELAGLEEIGRRAHANGVPNVRRLDRPELAVVEPFVRGVAAIFSPETAVVDYRQVARQIARDVQERGGALHFGERVTGIRESADEVVVRASGREYTFDHLVVCAGLHSAELATVMGAGASPAIVPFRGEYYELALESEHLVRSMVYPVPDPRYPFLGVHFTKGVHGGVHVGPNAVPALALEGYRWRDVDARQLSATLRWPGSRVLARQHWRMGLDEMSASVIKGLYFSKARRYIPDLEKSALRRSPSGVRAQALRADGTLEDDFALDLRPTVTHVRNAPSPAATSSLAIGEYLAEIVVDRLQ